MSLIITLDPPAIFGQVMHTFNNEAFTLYNHYLSSSSSPPPVTEQKLAWPERREHRFSNYTVEAKGGNAPKTFH
jgi:hypothetical protein